MAEEESRDWSTAFDVISDGLVVALKRAKRWRRDGPSLRSLNKRMCQRVSGYVHEIRPHTCRLLCEDDAKALCKFQNAATVDASQFITQGVRDYHSLVQDLAAMPHLNRLEFLTEECEAFLLDADLSPLSQVRVLNLGYRGLVAENHEKISEKVACLPLQQCSVNGGPFCRYGPSLEAHPRLRKCYIESTHQITKEDITKINALESVSLRGPAVQLDVFTALKSITSASLVIHPQDIHRVAALTTVEFLSLHPYDESFSEVVDISPLSRLRRLRSLSVSSGQNCSECDIKLEKPLEALRSLRLDICTLRGTQLRDNLHQVVSVHLYCCTVLEREAFFCFLKQAEALYFVDSPSFCSRFHGVCDIPWSPDAFSKLRTLYTRLHGLRSASARTVLSLTRLERLSIELSPENGVMDLGCDFSSWLQPVNGLTHLRELCVGGPEGAGGVLSDELLSNLEVLGLEAPAYHKNWWILEASEEIHWIHLRAPHLKTESEHGCSHRAEYRWFRWLWSL